MNFGMRKDDRYEINWPVEVSTAQASFSGKLINISGTGARLERTFVQLSTNQTITLKSAEHGIFRGSIRWISSEGVGIEFDQQTRALPTLSAELRKLKNVI